MKGIIANLHRSIEESRQTIVALHDQAESIARIGNAMVRTLRRGGKVLTAGNGGSAAEALHLAEELIGRFHSNRPALAAVALVADSTALTCIGNDFGFDHIFARQIAGLGCQGDMLVLFSTSGRAQNLRLALQTAQARRLSTVCFLGSGGGALKDKADYQIVIPGSKTARIQEAHQVLLHLVLEIVEEAFVTR
jgi:D-sedoheptulose 7-phosphate isomerase